MALSPNYGWSEPDNSSLVKNGAQDIRALGDAIDTSVWNIGFGQAGKNKIINGDFNIWQRGTSFACTGPTRVFGADRFSATGNLTYSRQNFTAGTAPVAGYENQYFARLDVTSNSANYDFGIRLEDARTFAGQTVTLSFWAKASSAASNVYFPRVFQNFGTGGSPSSAVYTDGASIALTTSWARYTTTLSIPSVSGKTFGTNNDSYLGVIIQLVTSSTITLDFWGWQLEYGSKATPFETATGTLQGELAAAMRYYERRTYNQVCYPYVGQAFISTAVLIPIIYSEKRGTPTLTLSGTWKQLNASGTGQAATYAFTHQQVTFSDLTATTTGMVAGNASLVETTAGTTYIEISAEL